MVCARLRPRRSIRPMPTLRILDVNPLDRAAEIKELFLTDDAPAFAEFFDRAYPSAVRQGGRSWVGVDAEGAVVTHIACFPRRFAFGEREVVGGVLLNLIAAKSHRTLLPALTLTRQMTADAKARKDVDFLYAVPNAAAGTLLKAAGFSVVGTLSRFVLPLAGHNWYTDVPVRIYQTMLRALKPRGAARVVPHDAQAFDAYPFARPVPQDSSLRPFRSPEVYQQCLAGYPCSADHWFTFERGHRSTKPTTAVLVRGEADRIASLLSISRDPSMSLSALIPGLAAALRRSGYARLTVYTMEGTPFARDLTRAGFVPRHDRHELLACPVTELGAEVLRSGVSWEITPLDCDPYLS